MNVDSFIPKALIRSILESYRKRGGQPELPSGTRSDAASWLRRVLVDFDAFEAHVGYLREEFERARGSQSMAKSSAPGRVVGQGLDSFWLVSSPLEEDLAFAVVQQGLEVLNDRALALLMVNPSALRDLARLIEDMPSEGWRQALEEAGKERMAKRGLSIPPSPAPPAPSSDVPTITGLSRQSRRLSPQDRDTLRQLLPSCYPDLERTPSRLDAFLGYVDEQLPRLPADRPFREVLPHWYAEFSRQ